MHGSSFLHLNFSQYLYMKTNIYHDLDSNTGLSFLSMVEIFQRVSLLQTFSFFALPLELLQGKTFRKTGSSSSSLCERWENDVPALGLGSDRSARKTEFQILTFTFFPYEFTTGYSFV